MPDINSLMLPEDRIKQLEDDVRCLQAECDTLRSDNERFRRLAVLQGDEIERLRETHYCPACFGLGSNYDASAAIAGVDAAIAECFERR